MKIESYKKGGETYYRFRLLLETDPTTGKQVRVQRSGFVTKLEAEKAAVKIKDTSTKKVNSETFEDVFYQLLEIKKINSKESYIYKLERTYENHFKEPLGSLKVSDIKTKELQSIVIKLYSKATTASKIFGLVEQVFRFSYKQRLIDENPCDFLEKPKTKKKMPTTNYYDKDELVNFLECAKRDLNHKWYVFFYLLAYTGIRRGEALALQWDDLKDNVLSINKTITNTPYGHVVGSSPKTSKSNRNILLDDNTASLLNTIRTDSPFIFPNQKGNFISPSGPISQLKRVGGVRYISPHGFRHTHCSLLFSAGVSIPEVQKRLGHEDVQTTLNIYNHVYKEDEENALKKFVGFMNEKQP